MRHKFGTGIVAVLVAIPSTTAAADLDVDAAREGLARLAAAYADWPEARPMDCPLLGRDVINGALSTAGVDSPLPAWDFGGTSDDGPGLECFGSFIGSDMDELNPETTVLLGAADLGTTEAVEQHVEDVIPEAGEPISHPGLVGSSVGTCEEERFATTCVELWSSDGLVVTVTVVDRVFLDRPTTAAVLADVVPVLIATLAANATDSADPLASIDDQAVAGAAAGLDAFIEPGNAGSPCPTVDAAAVEAALPGDDALDGWEMSIDTVESERVLSCTGTAGSTEVTLKVASFDDATAAEDFVASVGLPEGGSASDLPPGELTVGSCIDAGAEGRFCTEWWWRNGLVVGVWMLGDGVSADDAKSLLVEIVPAVVESIAAG